MDHKIWIALRLLFLVEIDKMILKFILEISKTEIGKIILKKNKVRGLILSNFKIWNKAAYSRWCAIDLKNRYIMTQNTDSWNKPLYLCSIKQFLLMCQDNLMGKELIFQQMVLRQLDIQKNGCKKKKRN